MSNTTAPSAQFDQDLAWANEQLDGLINLWAPAAHVITDPTALYELMFEHLMTQRPSYHRMIASLALMRLVQQKAAA